MEPETKRLMLIAATDSDQDARKRAGMSVVFDLERAGDFEKLWLMQSDVRLESEVRVEAGLAAIDTLLAKGKTMKLMFLRECSPFSEVNIEIRAELVRAGLVMSRKIENAYRRMGDRVASTDRPRNIHAMRI